ncbi:hypothetical protein ACT29H_05710 [Thermophagus sp. OGC60D27]|uniref:hypothetical protein n=1 Tax=Thermophagus sp. OGC60D27 TaxID=3458415 RepID=UPI004037EDEC
MKKIIIIILLLPLFFVSCKEDEEMPVSISSIGDEIEGIEEIGELNRLITNH